MSVTEKFTDASGLTRTELLQGGLAAGLAAGAVGVLADDALGATQAAKARYLPDGVATATGIHPFRVRVPRAQLAALRRRLAATRWPSRELVADRSQGVQLATIRRDLRGPAQLGRELLPQRHLLQQGRQGRPLRRLGRAKALLE